LASGAEDDQRPGKTDWTRIEALTGEEVLQNALADEDNPPLIDDQLARMRRIPDPQEIRQCLGLTQRECAQQFQIAREPYAIGNRAPADPTAPPKPIFVSLPPPQMLCAGSCRLRRVSVLSRPLAPGIRGRDA
jgi:putative transcriptional regulator